MVCILIHACMGGAIVNANAVRSRDLTNTNARAQAARSLVMRCVYHTHLQHIQKAMNAASRQIMQPAQNMGDLGRPPSQLAPMQDKTPRSFLLWQALLDDYITRNNQYIVG